MTPAYCTILARNYLPSALTLADSLRRFGSEHPLFVFLTDALPGEPLPDLPGVAYLTPQSLEHDQRELLELMMAYDLVEFATAVKPLVLAQLLRDFEQVVYCDPDTYQLSPMVELSPALEHGSGIVLTPHYLRPTPAGNGFSEGHLLHVGVFNLGFCAVDRKAIPMLHWWWSHLRDECLQEPLAGLFVDQKWMDVAAVLYQATSLQHFGYNVSVANLHERPIDRDAEGYFVAGTDDRVRLFHFHAFDPERPEALYTRPTTGMDARGADTEVLQELCQQYAAEVLAKRELCGDRPPYRYASDSRGRPIARRTRHAYRVQALAAPGTLPSPFLTAEADAYDRWRRQARGLTTKLIVSDLAKGARLAMPEEYGKLKRRLPVLTRRLRERYVEDSGMWG